jgi:preprotein translocase subunit SecG
MKLIQIGQIIVAILLIVVILLQNRGSGLSGIFGGSDNVYMTKRGMEKTLFTSTIIFSIIFFVISLLSIIL